MGNHNKTKLKRDLNYDTAIRQTPYCEGCCLSEA